MPLEIEPRETAERLRGADPPVLVDIREDWELEAGRIADSEHVPMSDLGTRLDRYRQQAIVLYCAHGNRSLRLAQALSEAGFEDVVSLAGGITLWAEEGLPVDLPGELDEAQRVRYSRHVLIPEIGVAGQQRLLNASILIVGAGGLGSPAALYLAAAGIGRLGIVDDDLVDESNLQRQVLHSTAALGEPKVASAEQRVRELNPDVEVVPYRDRVTSENVDRILDEGWEVIVDGADNFPTRYLLNDASVWHRIPVVHGSIFRFEGQATVFKPGDGPCYRCLFPQPPPPELAPSCAEGGVLGVLPGVIGSIQGAEALKLVLGIGEPLAGRLLLYDALAATFDEVAVRRDPSCPVCGDSPTITEYIDYVEFCAGPH
jgi:molybdopterin/thiamine biosynthesis adenylyltransferase/rhodanese-related sulfurtransferase